MQSRLSDYVQAAFSVRPIGMLVPPNWVGLGVFALLSFVSPGFLLLGAGLELAYLYVMATNPRFQRVVDGQRLLRTQREWQSRLEAAVARLGDDDRKRYRTLEQRCRSILTQQSYGSPASLRAQGEGLGRLLWIFVKLLLTRQAINRVCGTEAPGEPDRGTLETKIKRLEERLKKEGISDELRKSLTGQMDILQQRREKREEASRKLAFLESELDRIQEQVELIREQAVLSTDPQTVSQRIDETAATLGGTTQWILEQQQLYGQVEDLLEEPPPLLAAEQLSSGQGNR